MGLQGEQGDRGLQGEPGAQGDPGPQGPSGVVDLLSFDAYAKGISISGVPDACRTGRYTAGAGEKAALHFQATVQSGGADVGKLLTATPVVSTDGGATFPTKGRMHLDVMDSLAMSSVTSIAVSGVFELQASQDYVFGIYLGGGTITGNVSCSGIVTIARAN